MQIYRLALVACLSFVCTATFAAETVGGAPNDVAPALPEQHAAAEKTGDLIMYALSLAGVNYKYGGRSPETGLDCSGFVGHVFQQVAGLALPHNAFAISLAGKKISTGELRPGDLVFFKTMRRAFTHVGIYLGDNRFIHASSSKTGDVMISDMADHYWSQRFNGARRLLAPAEF